MSNVAPALTIGKTEIWPIMDGRLVIAEPPGFPSVDSAEFDVHREYIVNGNWLMDVGGFLVKVGERVVIIDAGAGAGDGLLHPAPPVETITDINPILARHIEHLGLKSEDEIQHFLFRRKRTKLQTGLFEESLRNLGVRPDEVTDVLLSHLHFDHIGWVSKDGLPFFPNAAIRCEEHDTDYFLSSTFDDSYHQYEFNVQGVAQRMTPVLDRLETWREDAIPVPGIEARFTPGHTPGSSIFLIRSGDESAAILGDAVHCPYELIDTTFNSKARPKSDLDLPTAEKSRQTIRELGSTQAVLLSSPHFPHLKFGRLIEGETSQVWKFEWEQ